MMIVTPEPLPDGCINFRCISFLIDFDPVYDLYMYHLHVLYIPLLFSVTDYCMFSVASLESSSGSV